MQFNKWRWEKNKLIRKAGMQIKRIANKKWGEDGDLNSFFFKFYHPEIKYSHFIRGSSR